MDIYCVLPRSVPLLNSVPVLPFFLFAVRSQSHSPSKRERHREERERDRERFGGSTYRLGNRKRSRSRSRYLSHTSVVEKIISMQTDVNVCASFCNESASRRIDCSFRPTGIISTIILNNPTSPNPCRPVCVGVYTSYSWKYLNSDCLFSSYRNPKTCLYS